MSEVSLPAPVGPWGLADLLDLPEDGRRYEILDGSLLVSPPPAPRHQRAARRLVDALDDCLGGRAGALEALEATGIELVRGPTGRVLVPDVLVARAAAVSAAEAVLHPGDVLLVVEVVSPSSRSADRFVKPRLYAEAGIPAYWRMELDPPSLTVYRLRVGEYAEEASARAGQTLRVDRPASCAIAPEDLVD